VADGACRIGAVTLRFAGDDPPGLRAWTLAGAAGDGPIDGLPTRRAPTGSPAAPTDSPPPPHPNGALRLDHVVVMTPDLERTFAALAAAGLDLRRVREAGAVRQGFYRAGEAILEVVGDVDPPGPARLWGLVVVVGDLDAAARDLGERLGGVRDAVQPGRRIATVRDAAGLGVPVAMMTPEA
jgi:hypothetical protein